MFKLSLAQLDSHWQVFNATAAHNAKFQILSAVVTTCWGSIVKTPSLQRASNYIQTIMYVKMYGDALWHHPHSFLKQFLQSDTVKPLFWPMSTLTSAVGYTVKVWKEWIQSERRECNLYSNLGPSATTGGALSDCSVWQMGIISRNPRRVTPNWRDFKVGVVFRKREGQINGWQAFHSSNVTLKQLYLSAVWADFESPNSSIIFFLFF